MNVRRRLFAALGAALLAAPLAGFAQKPRGVRRIGFLVSGSRPTFKADADLYAAFMDGMRALGYVEERDFVIEWRYGDNRAARLAELAEELVKMNCDVIVTRGAPANHAALRATRTVPIVVTVSNDPVGEGLAASLARPGGNVTGLAIGTAEYVAKHFELMSSVLPRMSRVAVLHNPLAPGHSPQIKTVRALAAEARIEVLPIAARTGEELEAGFAAMKRERAEALIILGDNFLFQSSRRIAQLALEQRLASIFAVSAYAESGGLMSYGPDLADNFRQAARYVDLIFKGAKPGELPIQQPTRLQLVVNLKTARSLGLAIPQSLLLRAERTIE